MPSSNYINNYNLTEPLITTKKQSDRRYLNRAHIPIRQLATLPQQTYQTRQGKAPTRNPAKSPPIPFSSFMPVGTWFVLFPRNNSPTCNLRGRLGLHPCHLGAESGESIEWVCGVRSGVKALVAAAASWLLFLLFFVFFSCARRTWQAGLGD
ncbi:hypothetical protein GGI35DRAFT_443770 [Trichoderma velutinum]